MKRTSICAVFLAILMGFGTAGIGALASVADVQAAKYLNAYSNIEAGKCIKHADLTIKKEDSHKVITSIHNGS